MNTNADYQRMIDVKATPIQAYEAVTSGFKEWWTDPETPLSRMGDVATFRFPPKDSSWTFRPVTLEPHRLVEHECVGAQHVHDGLPESIRTEWLGTKMRFEITPTEAGSRIVFTHEGLKPALDCFEVCEAGWDFFILESLRSYLNGEDGKPHR